MIDVRDNLELNVETETEGIQVSIREGVDYGDVELL